MNRIKLYWDELHPKLNYFTTEQLRQQTAIVERRRKIVECYFIPKSNNCVQITVNEHIPRTHMPYSNYKNTCSNTSNPDNQLPVAVVVALVRIVSRAERVKNINNCKVFLTKCFK